MNRLLKGEIVVSGNTVDMIKLYKMLGEGMLEMYMRILDDTTYVCKGNMYSPLIEVVDFKDLRIGTLEGFKDGEYEIKCDTVEQGVRIGIKSGVKVDTNVYNKKPILEHRDGLGIKTYIMADAADIYVCRRDVIRPDIQLEVEDVEFLKEESMGKYKGMEEIANTLHKAANAIKGMKSIDKFTTKELREELDRRECRSEIQSIDDQIEELQKERSELAKKYTCMDY